MSTLAVIRRETNSWRNVWIATGYLFGLAYLASFVTYQLASALA
jgi:ferrous iron transport protein B